MGWTQGSGPGAGHFCGLLAILFLGVWAYVKLGDGVTFDDAGSLGPTLAACRIPYRVAIGTIDPRFDLTEDDVRRALLDAIQVWERHAPRPLFELSERPSATRVALHFDERQAMSDAVAQHRVDHDQRGAELDVARADLDRLQRDFEVQREALRERHARHAEARRRHGREVAAYNRSPSRDAATRSRLKADRNALEFENMHLAAFSDEVEALQRQLQNHTDAFNERVARYNDEFGAASVRNRVASGPVTAGRYVRVGGNARIDVFLVNSYSHLVHTLAHELGHALRIEHVPDSDSIMSAVNTRDLGASGPVFASPTDIAALEHVCRRRF